jgi:hypothetical protein
METLRESATTAIATICQYRRAIRRRTLTGDGEGQGTEDSQHAQSDGNRPLASPVLISGGAAGVMRSIRREGRESMKKMSIRKAGTIRLTSSAYYCCSF